MRGPLLLIGGAEDKVGGRAILNRFVQLAGGSTARIVVIATASSFFDVVGQRYVSLFTALGAGHVEVLQVRERTDVQQEFPRQQLEQCSGIFITGGDQLKLTAVLGGTPVADAIHACHLRGGVIGGTSAGASVAAEHMMAYGASGIPPRKAMMQFAPGLGLINGVVVDQHFGARGRAGRLMTAVAHNPGLLGIGLDEDTAIEIDRNSRLTVMGQGSVIIVDGIGMSFTDIHYVPDQAPLSIFDLRVHILASGYHYDLPSRTPMQPSAPPPELPESGFTEGAGI